jgi:hypothetical protein
MDQVLAALDATWRILLIGILLGAGLPTLFAVGVRALAWGGTDGAPTPGVRPPLKGRLVAYLCFGVAALAVLLGITYIVLHGLGINVTFNGVIPVFTPKH